MPKVSVYVPDAMYDELRARNLPISKLAQDAFARALESGANQEWVRRARSRPLRTTGLATEDLMAEVDTDFGA